MPKKQEPTNDLTVIVQLLQNLLAIELWRGGLSQIEIARRLHISTTSANIMLKGVSREVATKTCL